MSDVDDDDYDISMGLAGDFDVNWLYVIAWLSFLTAVMIIGPPVVAYFWHFLRYIIPGQGL